MPTYEFACPQGHSVEEFHRITQVPASIPCPTCGRKAARQIGSGAAAMCKGSGFYSTDNRTDGYRTHSTLHSMGEKHAERVSKAGIVKRTTRDQG